MIAKKGKIKERYLIPYDNRHRVTTKYLILIFHSFLSLLSFKIYLVSTKGILVKRYA